jgi:hypothetical protein
MRTDNVTKARPSARRLLRLKDAAEWQLFSALERENRPEHPGENGMTPEPFVTPDEVAQHLKITRRQALELTRKGVIPGYPVGVRGRRNL